VLKYLFTLTLGEVVAKSKNQKLLKWIKEVEFLCSPDKVEWVDGSREEYDRLFDQMCESGMAIRLNEKKRPNSYLFRSDPSDVARVESRTYIASETLDEAGPTNNWMDPVKLKEIMSGLYKGCMRGRVMYVIPFSMGPIGSPISKIGVEITDSPYVVVNMHIMTRVGNKVLEVLGEDGDFVPCLHSVGAPLNPGEKDTTWPCAPLDKKYIAHFPQENLIWSYGSGYGGNALLGKKCLALRIASNLARHEGWMAEHMLILRLTNPEGRRFHIAAAFPSACGKTNLAMLVPTIKGWKCETIGDDIAWMKIGLDGSLRAINPEAGFFGVAPGTSKDSNLMAMRTLDKNCIFTNCALSNDKDIWWEGIGWDCNHAIDWKGRAWTPDLKEPAAHPNARFTALAEQCPVICPDWEDPQGVPIDIFVFGGRRSTTIPLVHQAFDFEHGVFLGASAASETTAAALDVGQKLRRDPFAMTPFIGYNAGDYFAHWFEMGRKLGDKAPLCFYVNWFRKTADGRWLWPGFGDNSRVLKWMCQRLENKVDAIETPIGWLPNPQDLDLEGLNLSAEDLDELLFVDTEAFKADLEDAFKYFAQFGTKLPNELKNQLEKLKKRLG
jgi:phosphoenolpyruvate carboxykinase (GTP)